MKIQLLLLALSMTCAATAQLSGTAYYQSKTTVDMNNFGRSGMSEDQKRMIADRMKPYLEKTYILDFKDHESIYREEEKLELEGSGRGFAMMVGSFPPGDQYKNSKTNQVLEEREFFGKMFLVNDTLTNLDWTVTKESKMIGQYLVIKAEANMELDENDLQFLRRRRPLPKEEPTDSIAKQEDPMDSMEVPKQILVTAWFSPQIPVGSGPGAYAGLPGLILELNTGRTTVLCSKLVLNPEKAIVIEAPDKGQEVSREEYNKIVKEKTEEMRENFRGRGGRPGGRRPGG